MPQPEPRPAPCCLPLVAACRLGYERALLRLLDRLVAEMDRKASCRCPVSSQRLAARTCHQQATAVPPPSPLLPLSNSNPSLPLCHPSTAHTLKQIIKAQERARMESAPKPLNAAQQAEVDVLRQQAKGGWLGWGWVACAAGVAHQTCSFIARVDSVKLHPQLSSCLLNVHAVCLRVECACRPD